jgi:hypothetical protein
MVLDALNHVFLGVHHFEREHSIDLVGAYGFLIQWGRKTENSDFAEAGTCTDRGGAVWQQHSCFGSAECPR